MNAASPIETFLVGLLERLFAMLWNQFQTWIEQPGNFDKALTYIDDILTSVGIAVNDPTTGAPIVTPAPAVPGTPSAAPVQSSAAPTFAKSVVADVAAVEATVSQWFAGHTAPSAAPAAAPAEAPAQATTTQAVG